MTRKVYIRPNLAELDFVGSESTESELLNQCFIQCLFTDAQQSTGKVKQGTLAELAAELIGAEIVLVLPAEQVLLTSVQLPGKNQARLKQALPFALEEQLITDIDAQYFVLGPKLDEQQYAVAVISRVYLENILDSFRQVNIFPAKVLPESLLLPFTENGVSVVEDDERFIVRNGKYSGFACDKENISLMLGNIITNNTVAKIDFYGTSENITENLGEIECTQHAAPAALISLLYHDTISGLELLPTRYINREKIDLKIKRWLPAVAMLLTGIMLQVSIQVYDYFDLKKQDAALQQTLEKIYRQAFPDARKIVDVEAQMRQRLEELRKRSGKAESGFTEMMVKSAPVLQQAPGLKLQALRYQNGQMDLELEVRDLDSLEQLKENLIKTGGWQVEIQSASSTENKVQGRLQVRGSSS